jgi:uncharacterized protein YyaL (SSP411 family)
MERESFEDPETAALMNQHFVCIKVDREERPDLDQIYMGDRSAGRALTVFYACGPFHAALFRRAAPDLPSFRRIRLTRLIGERRGEVKSASASWRRRAGFGRGERAGRRRRWVALRLLQAPTRPRGLRSAPS